jgi:cell wall-associated NlpC family hydrolase
MQMSSLIRKQIIKEAETWLGTKYKYGGNSSSGIDCSHFVYRVMSAVLPDWGSYKTVHQIRSSANLMCPVKPQMGDIISWQDPLHMGIIYDPDLLIFIGAQSSTGVAKARYSPSAWWGKQKGLTFSARPQ